MSNLNFTVPLIIELMRRYVQSFLTGEGYETGLGTIRFMKSLDWQVVNRDVV